MDDFEKIFNFFKELGHGYRCNICHVEADVTKYTIDEFCFDYVTFQCPKCGKRWIMELKHNEIRNLLKKNED